LESDATPGKTGQPSSSTSPPHARRSLRDWLGGPTGEAILEGLSPNALLGLPWLFEHWALTHQLPPEGDWTTWVVLGGRGAGKTRAGAEWVRAQVEGGKPGDPGVLSRVALVGATLDEAREVMVFGPSGLIAIAPPDRRPEWQATRRRLVWPNGAVAQIFSAADPESLRGPQFDGAWCDELAKWKKGEAAWDMLMFGLRLGERPRALVTTTPRRSALLKGILEEAGTVMTGAPTAANRMHLARSFLAHVMGKYGGSRRGREELEGELLLDVPGALWTWEMLEAARALPARPLDRVVVAVDPPVSSGESADACGIVVAGVSMRGEPREWTAEVIFDGSAKGLSPRAWAERAVALYHAHGADRLVAETNQGGNLVGTLVRDVDPMVAFRALRASKGKGARAEPVAALYEQGRVRHRAAFAELEAEMAAMTVEGFEGKGSPDRADAMVWAITELMIEPGGRRDPRVRAL
jgi:phage terminase large subunit-like protein